MSTGPYDPSNPLSLGHRPGLSHDTRKDLGYGLSKEKYHKPRKKAATFPYPESIDVEDIELGLSDDQLNKIKNKISTPYKSHDNLIGRSIDRDSMANGNRPIAIGEVSGKSLVPFPGMYKDRIQVGGGVNSPKSIAPGQYNRTGTYRGWSHSSIPPNDLEDIEPEEEALEKVRNIVRTVLARNLREI